MEFSRLKHGNMITVTLSGRLDAAGAADLDVYIEHCRGEDPCRNYLFNMADVPYVSSAALRVFTLLARKTDAEQGKLVFYGFQPFCLEVLTITGLDKALKIFTAKADAEAFCLAAAHHGEAVPAPNAIGDTVKSAEATYEFIPLAEEAARLRVFGDINNIMHAQLAAPVVHGCKFSDIRDSLGFGALGSVPTDYLPAIGHMLTADGRLFWTPANTASPDFLFPDDNNLDQVLLQSGFNLALDGSWHELVRLETSDAAGGVEFGHLTRELLRLTANRHPEFKGMFWLSMLAATGPVFMRSMKRAPLGALAPENNKTIDHFTNCQNWYDHDDIPCQREGVAIINCVAADLMHDLSDYSEMLLERVFRLSPMSMGGKDCLMHSHAALFRNVEYPAVDNDLRADIRRVGENGMLVRMGEMQEKTRIRHALIGLTMIDALELPEQLDAVAAHRLDYRLHRAKTLLDTYSKTSENHP